MNDPARRLTRAHLDELPSYRPGRRPEQLAGELGIAQAVKLSSNELPFGPLPGVTEAVADAAAQLHRYPDMFAGRLRDALARRHGVDPGEVVTGCGSVALCEHLALACAAPGDEIVFGWRSFEAYPLIASRLDARAVRVPNTADHRLDIDGIIKALTPDTRMIFLCSPNNPTGTAVRADELNRLLAAVDGNTLVVLDEAYREFVTDGQVPDGLTLRNEHPNLVVLRTFSKAWGLAAARLGYLIATPEIAAAVAKVLTTYSTSGLAQAAGLAALAQEAESARRVAIIIKERDRVVAGLRKFVPRIPDSQGNFCWLPVGEQAAEIAAAFETNGIIVRGFSPDSSEMASHGGVRISIGSPEENDALLTASETVFARRHAVSLPPAAPHSFG